MTEQRAARPGPAAGAELDAVPAWFLQSVYRGFAVGDRVRVRLSECQQDWGPGSWDRGHPERFNNATGFVSRIVEDGDSWAHHPYIVDLDDIPVCGTVALYCAAIELEPLAATGSGPGAGEEGE